MSRRDLKGAEPRPTAGIVAPSRREVRPEIQALRALAVLAVVGNHFWPGLVHGGFIGVDIFFVISGFLITGHLIRESTRSGRIRLGAFWARRARRLLPASLLVLLASLVITAVALPVSSWQNVMRHVGAAALYVENWALAADATDYFASAASPSPVTHYWSLSAEEQFYIVWPLIIIGAIVLAARLAARRERVVAIVLGVVVAASFAFSIWWTAADPLAAYFITPTRAWEFGVGGLLALVPAAVVPSARARTVLAWAAWVVLVGCVLIYRDTLPFPGWVAALPVVATAAVIWSGTSGTRFAPDRLVSLRPVQWVGDISYSLYLWHWPLVILLLAVIPQAGTVYKLALLVVALVLSAVTKRFVEDPFRAAPWLQGGVRTLVASVATMALVVGAAGGVWLSVQQRFESVTAQLEQELDSGAACFGAAATAADADCADPHLLTFPDSVLVNAVNTRNVVPNGDTCQQDRDIDAILECTFGAPEDRATTRVALVGDSHAGHWSSALGAVAAERGWRVDMIAKSSCAFNASDGLSAVFYPAGAESCRAWNDAVLQRIVADPEISIVFTSSISREYTVDGGAPADTHEAQAAGYRETWAALAEAGKTVVVLADLPQMGVGDIPECVAKARSTVDPCTADAATALTTDPLLAAAEGQEGVLPLDLTGHFCDAELCHSVIGGFVAYGDANHMSSFFARSIAPFLASAVRDLP